MHIYTVREIKLKVYTLKIGGYNFWRGSDYSEIRIIRTSNFPEWENLKTDIQHEQ